ncbi:MAG: lactate utilization protein [Bacteroidia bacterium]|nr:lactate utilization protein [Bacteroidia bacterium]
MKTESKFFEAIESIAFNKEHKALLQQKLSTCVNHTTIAKAFYSDLELARTRAAFLKSKTLDNLDKYLIEFESNFIKRGAKVIWAQDKDEAIKEIAKLIEKKSAKVIAKNRALIAEEIDIANQLQINNTTCVESDIGNYIQKLAGEVSYHPIFPTLHQSQKNIAQLINSELTSENSSNSRDIAALICLKIKQQLKEAEIALMGVNFLIADTGSAVIIENEANSAQLASLTKTQVFLAGIEDIIPSINELDLFIHLYGTYSNGSASYPYTHIISGQKQNDETTGPDDVYVVLIDNGRSDVLAQTNQRSALSCLRCGACYNVCPVYRTIGGHAYQTVYNGPIGAVITPLMQGREEYKYLSYATVSSQELIAACPVKIDCAKLVQHNRTESIKLAPPGKTEKLSIFFWKTAMLKRSNMDKGGAKLKNFMMRQFYKKSWGDRREMPQVATKSFNQLWRERKGIK